MTDVREIFPVDRPVSGTIRPPGSKSLTNRALVIAALAEGTSHLTGVLDSRDTFVMIDSLQRLGIAIDHSSADCSIIITGCSGRLTVDSADLWLENSGTSIRFLTALCALGHGRFRLDGNTRMRERPIGDLLASLRQFGVSIAAERETDCPPVVVIGGGFAGGRVTVNANVSSQFLSAILMAAPCAIAPVDIRLEGEMVSEPYIEMTLKVMSKFGVAVEGLSANGLQGDVRFVEALQKMGCEVTRNPQSITVQGRPLQGIEIDMNDISDTAQTLACVAVFAQGPTRIRNVAHMRHKETDRVKAVVTELRKLGLLIEEFPDGMTIHPGPLKSGTVATYDDHRMAMSFSLLGLRVPGIMIADPDCTSKTYPRFFEDFDRLCLTGRIAQ